MIIIKSSEKWVKKDENFGNLIYLNPPLNNQENTNESKLKLSESKLKLSESYMNVQWKYERSWMFMDFQIFLSWMSEVVFNWLKNKK